MNPWPFAPEDDDEFGYGLDEDLDPEIDDALAPDGPLCVQCGCSETEPCEGGCIWATDTLCSRCA
jgi:hypothetical protein